MGGIEDWVIPRDGLDQGLIFFDTMYSIEILMKPVVRFSEKSI